MNKFENLKIQKIVIHRVYKRVNSSEIVPPYFNKSCTELEDQAKVTLMDRITNSLSNKSYAIQMEIENDGEGSIAKNIIDFWKTDMSEEYFLALSKEITYKLANSQTTKGIPGGIVIVLHGTVQEMNKNYVAILKAENQSGFTIEESDGTMMLKYFNDLLLTPQQKFQKIGFFINNAVSGREILSNDLDVFLFDSNTDTNAYNAKANYFYNAFLGLTFRKDSDILTNQYFTETKEFIRTCDRITPTKKMELMTGLINYLSLDASQFVNAQTFANSYIGDAQLQDLYINYMESKGVAIQNIRKNLAMVKDKLKKRQFTFDHNIRLQVPADEFRDSIQIKENEDGSTTIIVKGKLINEK